MRSITPTHAIWRLAGVLLVAALLPAPAAPPTTAA